MRSPALAKSRRGRALVLALVLALTATLAPPAACQRLAYDEGDGHTSAGFADGAAAYGGWAGTVTSDGAALVATVGNHWRTLAAPANAGVVWYAVTLRLRDPLTGYASVVPAPGPGGQYSELGFNTGFGTDEGLWTTAGGVVRSGVAATTLQTLLQRYDLDARRWSAWACAGDGLALLDEAGEVTRAPLVDGAPLAASTLGALYLTKGSPQALEVHRLALARTAREALTPVAPEHAPPLEAPADAPVPKAPLPDAGVLAFARDAALPRGAAISLFGDSLTWQGGHVEVLRRALAEHRPDLGVSLHQRGINGGKSTDLVSGVVDLYGSTQAAFGDVLAADRPCAAVLQIGINDVWHGATGNPPEVFARALGAMLDAAHAANVPVLLCTPTLIGERRENPFDPPLDALCAVVRDLASARAAAGERVVLCDLRAAFRAALGDRNPADAELGVLTYDGVHLSEDGNRLLAHHVGDGLRVLLGHVDDAPVPYALVPWPRELVPGEGPPVRFDEVAVAVDDAGLAPHAEVLAAAIRALRPSAGAQAGVQAGARVLRVHLQSEPSYSAEHYTLETGDQVFVRGRDLEAIARGTATLLQLVTPAERELVLPRVEVADGPTCTYRGLLVDVARQPHPVAVLEDLITLCWLSKVRYLQLHLTDDQAFTFPSQAFPLLATPGHSYTLAELRGLEAFATARGVTLIPELDVPGHSGAAIAAMPDLFRASVKHHATIDFADPAVLAALDTLLGELVDVFRASPYVHIGGDECDLTYVHEEPSFQAAFAREGVTDAHELYRRFLCQMRDLVHARGKSMLVWEGFGPEGVVAIPTDVTVMAFEMLYHTPDRLVAAGYPVINTSWRPLYVVNDRAWSEREIYLWHRGAFRHFVPGIPAYDGLEVPREKVLGGQICAWEQPAARELPSLRRRLPAMAERLWNEDAGREADEFLARLARTDRRLKLLLRATGGK